MGREKVICCWEVDGVLVDPGPQSCEATLLEALGGERPRALLLTHIHFDHAGPRARSCAAGPTCRSTCTSAGRRTWPTRAKLVVSAARLYGGEEGLRAAVGRGRPRAGGEPARARGRRDRARRRLRVEYTPGHASHHVCYLHEPRARPSSATWRGVRIPPSDFTLAPDAAARHRRRGLGALARLVAGWGPERARADALRRRRGRRGAARRGPRGAARPGALVEEAAGPGGASCAACTSARPARAPARSPSAYAAGRAARPSLPRPGPLAQPPGGAVILSADEPDHREAAGRRPRHRVSAATGA